MSLTCEKGVSKMGKHICPWWLAWTFDNPLRRLFHNPKKIFASYIDEGMSVVDIGCGMGYFSIGMAKIVGESGHVIAVDVQQEMLDILLKRAKKESLSDRIQTVLCDVEDIAVDEQVDFALTFWMVHETPNQHSFLKQVYGILKQSGKLLLAEPKLHVTSSEFEKTVTIAEALGFKLLDRPQICCSHTALFEKQ